MFDSQWAMSYTLKVFACLERQFTNDERQRLYFNTNYKVQLLLNRLYAIYHSIYIKDKSYKNKAREWIVKIEFSIRLGQIQSSDLKSSRLYAWLDEFPMKKLKFLKNENMHEKLVDIITNHPFLNINKHPEWLVQKGKLRKPVG